MAMMDKFALVVLFFDCALHIAAVPCAYSLFNGLMIDAGLTCGEEDTFAENTAVSGNTKGKSCLRMTTFDQSGNNTMQLCDNLDGGVTFMCDMFSNAATCCTQSIGSPIIYHCSGALGFSALPVEADFANCSTPCQYDYAYLSSLPASDDDDDGSYNGPTPPPTPPATCASVSCCACLANGACHTIHPQTNATLTNATCQSESGISFTWCESECGPTPAPTPTNSVEVSFTIPGTVAQYDTATAKQALADGMAETLGPPITSDMINVTVTEATSRRLSAGEGSRLLSGNVNINFEIIVPATTEVVALQTETIATQLGDDFNVTAFTENINAELAAAGLTDLQVSSDDIEKGAVTVTTPAPAPTPTSPPTPKPGATTSGGLKLSAPLNTVLAIMSVCIVMLSVCGGSTLI